MSQRETETIMWLSHKNKFKKNWYYLKKKTSIGYEIIYKRI